MALTAAEIPKGPPFVTDTDGRLVVSSSAGLGAVTGTPADAFASPGAIPEHMAFPELYNGTTWDRQRANQEGTLLASAARTAATTSANQTNYNARGVYIFLNVTVAGTGNLQLYIQDVDPVSAAPVGINGTAVTVTTTGLTQLVLYPGAAAGTGATQGIAATISEPLPRTWNAVVYKLDASSWTYSLGYALIN